MAAGKILIESDPPIAVPFENLEESAQQAVSRLKTLGPARMRVPLKNVDALARLIANQVAAQR